MTDTIYFPQYWNTIHRTGIDKTVMEVVEIIDPEFNILTHS